MLPELLTERLILRPLEPDDAGRVHAYRTDPNVGRFQSWDLNSVQEVRQFIDRMRTLESLTSGEWLQLGIFLREMGELVGDCGLHPRADDPRQVEIGITLAPAFQRRGLAREAFSAVLRFLFTSTETHRAFCSVDPRNESCQRLLRSVGMRREAHLIESLWIRDAWCDDLIFAMLRREWTMAMASAAERDRIAAPPPPVPRPSAQIPCHGYRKCTPEDRKWAYALKCEAYREVVERQFGPWDETFQRQLFATRWQPDNASIIRVEDQDVGLVAIEDRGDELWLDELQIVAAWRGRGLGSAILQELVQRGKRDRKPLRLQVLKQNRRARELYERSGFAVISTTETHDVMEHDPRR